MSSRPYLRAETITIEQCVKRLDECGKEMHSAIYEDAVACEFAGKWIRAARSAMAEVLDDVDAPNYLGWELKERIKALIGETS